VTEPTKADVEAARQAYLASVRADRAAKPLRSTKELSYMQKRAVWSAMTARNRSEALRAMELYVDHDEAVQLQDEAEAPLEVPEYAPGDHPAERLMSRVKSSVRL
jgi:hypothetical protein